MDRPGPFRRRASKNGGVVSEKSRLDPIDPKRILQRIPQDSIWEPLRKFSSREPMVSSGWGLDPSGAPRTRSPCKSAEKTAKSLTSPIKLGSKGFLTRYVLVT